MSPSTHCVPVSFLYGLSQYPLRASKLCTRPAPASILPISHPAILVIVASTGSVIYVKLKSLSSCGIASIAALHLASTCVRSVSTQLNQSQSESLRVQWLHARSHLSTQLSLISRCCCAVGFYCWWCCITAAAPCHCPLTTPALSLLLFGSYDESIVSHVTT